MNPPLSSSVFSVDDLFLMAFLMAHHIQPLGAGKSADGRRVMVMFPQNALVENLQKRFWDNDTIPVQELRKAYERAWNLITRTRRGAVDA